jgi:hypothetical protein
MHTLHIPTYVSGYLIRWEFIALICAIATYSSSLFDMWNVILIFAKLEITALFG